MNKKFSTEQIEKAISLYSDGVAIKDIKSQIGISRPRLKEILREKKVPRRLAGFQIGNKLSQGRILSKEARLKISNAHKSNGHKPSKEASDKGRVGSIKVRWGSHEKDPAGQIMRRYQKEAARKKLSFSLSFDDFSKLISGACYYCGELPSNLFLPYFFLYNGVDRVCNNRGYHISNCVSCCKKCNMMKKSLSKAEFIEKCKIIARRFTK